MDRRGRRSFGARRVVLLVIHGVQRVADREGKGKKKKRKKKTGILLPAIHGLAVDVHREEARKRDLHRSREKEKKKVKIS